MKRILIDNKQEDLKQIAYSIPWKSDTVCLQQICICNSHVESIQPIANLIKNKKEKYANSKEFKEKLECDIEGIYIETDRCSVNEEELDFSGIYIGEIKIRKMK